MNQLQMMMMMMMMVMVMSVVYVYHSLIQTEMMCVNEAGL